VNYRDFLARILENQEHFDEWIIVTTADDLKAYLVSDTLVFNHTLFTVKAIQAAGLVCAGVVLNQLEAERDVAATTNRMILDELCPVPIVGEVLTDADWIDWRE
jgi:dethiobiotin synthetase